MDKKKWYTKLLQTLVENGAASKDARIGALGADQVRELYKEDKDEQAQRLAENYLKANVAGITTGIGGAGTLSSISNIGLIPTITVETTGAAGGYGGYKLGEVVDNKLGTKVFAPALSFIGGIGTGMGAYKGLVNYGINGRLVRGTLGKKLKDSTLIWGDEFRNAVDKATINKAIKAGKLQHGDADSYIAYHQSDAPITEFKFPYERWDVVYHGADPNSAFFTVGSPANSGFLSKRPYVGQFQVELQKPMIQTGEIHGMSKNGIRNKIVQLARQEGADGILFDGIADNQLQNQKILQAFENANIKHQRTIQIKKQGGSLPKFQPGGLISSPEESEQYRYEQSIDQIKKHNQRRPLEELNNSKLGKTLDAIDLTADAVSMIPSPAAPVAGVVGTITGIPQAMAAGEEWLLDMANEGFKLPTWRQGVAMAKLIPTGGITAKMGQKAWTKVALSKDGFIKGLAPAKKIRKILDTYIPNGINLGTDIIELVDNYDTTKEK